MRCQTCVDEGAVSIVYDGGGSITLMWVSTFFDGEGQRHSHDPNAHTCSYRCSRGHSWTIKRYSRCSAPGCKYNAPEPKEEIKGEVGKEIVEYSSNCVFCDLDIHVFQAPPQWVNGAGEWFHMTKKGPVPCTLDRV